MRGDESTVYSPASSPAPTPTPTRHYAVPEAEALLDLSLDFGEKHRIVPQEELGVFAALADTLIAVGVPGS